MGNKRNFSLSIWDHKDNFLCLLKPASGEINGQSYNELVTENIYGEKTLTFNIPAYVYDENYKPYNPISNTTDSNSIGGWVENEKWNYIFNEQKIRYIEYDDITNKPKDDILEFVIKNHIESRNGYEKIIQVTCEFLATYELSKVGWSINFNTEYISKYESENNPSDFLQLDYWLRKIFYWETNLGRVSTTRECTYLLQGLQLRNSDGAPINSEYAVDEDGNFYYKTRSEPSAITSDVNKYRNNAGWTWEIQAIDPRKPGKQVSTSTLYEEPKIDRYIEVAPNYYKPFSYQYSKLYPEEKLKIWAADTTYHKGDRVLYTRTKHYYELQIDSYGTGGIRPGLMPPPIPDWKDIGLINYAKEELLPFPMEEEHYDEYMYATEIKKRLITCERSNIFSIIQDLCEAFGVWAYFKYKYDEQGKIIERKILFKTEAINDEIKFDFSYGKNLASCSRTIDSNELVTKLIIPDTESSLDSDKILSIKQATANPTGEGYIYNFDYFYNIGTFTRGESVTTSDEYKINLHCGKLKNYNTRITNLQSYLVPLYNRQLNLQGDLSVQTASKTGLMDNIQAIQDKIDAIPTDQQIIQSWSNDKDQYNYIGELKTISTTTKGNETLYYIDFGREDILYENEIGVTPYILNADGELVEGESFTTPAYMPRYFTSNIWQTGTEVDDNDFTILSNNTNMGEPVFSIINNTPTGYIKGYYLKQYPDRSYIRIRYKYAPLAFYYMLIKDYWNKLLEVEKVIEEIESDLQEINNKIIVNELELNNILNEKNELILQFEKEYGTYIKEGYWEPTEYQSQLYSEQVNTSFTTSIYEGLISVNTKLSELNLNNSLHNYSYYINLGINATDIDIDSISMKTENPAGTGNTILPRYRGNDYEVFLEPDSNVVLGIAPSLIDSYEKYSYAQQYYSSIISYSTSNGVIISSTTKDWLHITDEQPIWVVDKYIYLSDDNLLTSSLSVYGTSVTTNNLLEPYTDYTYTFDYAGYTEDGQRVPLDEQTSYSTDIYYDYITKITLKNTNNVNKHNNFIVNYNKETTLQYLYNDSVATGEKYAVPQISYDISVVDLSSLNDYKDYKPILGQKVPIYDPEMRLNGYEGIITSVEKELEQPENTKITIATYQTRFTDIFQKLTATMTDVRYNENSIYNAANSFEVNTGTIKTEVFQKSLEQNNFQIQLGTNNDITIDKKSGITLVDQDSSNAVKLVGNGIFLTDNYIGNDSMWRTGITGEGINANTLIAGNIDTKNINIWNASEGQIRFIWNEQGLFAYGSKGIGGTSTSTAQDFVDYTKYVKYSYDGLEFKDGNRSALTLGWNGLNINTQNNSLNLTANDGLVLQEWNGNSAVKRLELGKLDNSTVYGLKLYDSSQIPTLQSDSDGNLWLHQHLRMGGAINNGVVQNATAGIYGLSTNVPPEMQMGIRRDQNGTVIWDSTPIRFWAGPQTKTSYTTNIHIGTDELNAASGSTNFYNLTDSNSPSLSKFKVSANGDIIASGIDVGGWIGEGDKLRSFDNEAILRSNGYDQSGANNPLIAIGKNGETEYGSLYNFRVYQDGTLSIGNGQFVATSTGAVIAQNITINSTSSAINGGSIANWQITETGIEKISGNYKTGMYAVAGTDGKAIQIGTSNNPEFYVTGKGALVATGTTITGTINANTGKIGGENGFTITAGKIYTENKSTLNSTADGLYLGIDGISLGEGFTVIKGGSVSITKGSINIGNDNFKVDTNGNVSFKGTITAYYDGSYYTGLDQEIITVTVGGVTTNYRVVKGLIVGRSY